MALRLAQAAEVVAERRATKVAGRQVEYRLPAGERRLVRGWRLSTSSLQPDCLGLLDTYVSAANYPAGVAATCTDPLIDGEKFAGTWRLLGNALFIDGSNQPWIVQELAEGLLATLKTGTAINWTLARVAQGQRRREKGVDTSPGAARNFTGALTLRFPAVARTAVAACVKELWEAAEPFAPLINGEDWSEAGALLWRRAGVEHTEEQDGTATVLLHLAQGLVTTLKTGTAVNWTLARLERGRRMSAADAGGGTLNNTGSETWLDVRFPFVSLLKVRSCMLELWEATEPFAPVIDGEAWGTAGVPHWRRMAVSYDVEQDGTATLRLILGVTGFLLHYKRNTGTKSQEQVTRIWNLPRSRIEWLLATWEDGSPRRSTDVGLADEVFHVTLVERLYADGAWPADQEDRFAWVKLGCEIAYRPAPNDSTHAEQEYQMHYSRIERMFTNKKAEAFVWAYHNSGDGTTVSLPWGSSETTSAVWLATTGDSGKNNVVWGFFKERERGSTRYVSYRCTEDYRTAWATGKTAETNTRLP